MRTRGRILSIHTGRVQAFGGDSDAAESWTSAICKAKVSGAVQVQQTGIVGDQQADLVHHGGPDKAILTYAAQHYDQWNAEFPGKGFDAGSFGENLTVADLDESQCCIGDTFRVGDCVMEISQPRQPCWKLSRRWDLPKLAVLVQQNGRTGWYPLVAPPVQPRLSSPPHWASIAEDLVIPLLRRAASWWSAEDLRSIKDVLREKRNLGSLQNITAIGSDGQVRKYCSELDRLIEGAFLATKSRDPDIRENAKRLLAYTSTASPSVQVYLVKHSKIVPARNEDFRMIGNCLRDENAIRSFLNTCHSHQLSGDHDYVRTIAELASYRESALSQIETETLNKIYESIASGFREHSKCSNLGLPFRYLTLCVAFLPRRRIFDDSFVPPDGKIASLVKETCLNVIERHKKRTIRIMGGSVDLPAVMMQLIKYANREGQGAFVLAT